MNEDENYLEQEFPKGKTKFRGQAMVLIALSRVEGKLQERERIIKLIKHRRKVVKDIIGYKNVYDELTFLEEELKKEVDKNGKN